MTWYKPTSWFGKEKPSDDGKIAQITEVDKRTLKDFQMLNSSMQSQEIELNNNAQERSEYLAKLRKEGSGI